MESHELDDLAVRERTRQGEYAHQIGVCVGSGCASSRSQQIRAAFDAEVKKQGHHCRVKGVGCMGLCGAGPMVFVDDDAVLY